MLKRKKVALLFTLLFILLVFIIPFGINFYETNKWNSKLATRTLAEGDKQKQDLIYVALGDSISTGLNSLKPYPVRYKEALEKESGRKIQLLNLSQNNWTSADLLNAIRTDNTYVSAILNADIITLEIGGNDFLQGRGAYKSMVCGYEDNKICLTNYFENFKLNWDSIIRRIKELNTKVRFIKTLDFYYPLVNYDMKINTIPQNGQNDYLVLKNFYNNITGYIKESSKSNGFQIAEVSLRFNGPDINDDPFDKGYLYQDRVHPSEYGHEVIKEQLMKLDNSI